jgi:transcriptional regulator with PAS, ATPase and Fis domain
MSSLHRFPGGTSEPVLIGDSAAMQLLRATIERIAQGDSKVLVTGESGVGKDVVSRYLHFRSPRRDRPFVAVNCAAFSDALLESELFGHVRGSFTGAIRDKIGKLQLAHTGTILLDEIGEMSLRMQAMLLRFLENGELQPVGSDRSAQRVDVRVIAATNRDLRDLIASGRFREDLMYRLKVVHLHVPPLRERRDDIRPLICHAFTRIDRAVVFSEAALRAFESHRWPGNVRELQNVVEQLAWTVGAPVVEAEDLPPALREHGPGLVTPKRERRKQIADELYKALVSGTYSFWEHVHPLFLARDITRLDLRQLVRLGLTTTGGNYRGVLKLFGLPEQDYKRFLNFLAAHDCTVDFRPFRSGHAMRKTEDSVAPQPSTLPSGEQERSECG